MLASICLISLLLLCFTFSAQGTQESHPKYEAEGLFLVDDEVVRKYMREMMHISDSTLKRQMAELEVHNDLNYTLSEVNKIFETLKVHRLNISILVSHIAIGGDIVYQRASPDTQGGRNAKMVLESLDSYLQLHNASVIYRYDFVILFTGFDLLVNDERNHDGYANDIKVCDRDARNPLGVVEFLRNYPTVMTTTRLIAFILGANYDGAASKNIMSPYLSASTLNRWYFHECSAVSIREYINSTSSNNNCLLRTSGASYKMSVEPENYHGSMHNVDDICRRALNNVSAYMARGSFSYLPRKNPGGDGVCNTLNCKLRGKDYYQPQHSFNGLMCEINKSCSRGRCTSDRTPNPNITFDCLYGNQPVIEILDQYSDYGNQPVIELLGTHSGTYSGSCEDFLNTYGTRKCYNDYVFASCCASCKARRTGILGCEYGDKNETCGTWACEINSHGCCYLCRNYNGGDKRSADLLDSEPLP